MMEFVLGGGVLASCLVLVFVLFSFAEKKRKKKKALCSKWVRSNWVAKISENGKCQTEDDAGSAEIIIVGAGVAGAALAYTLGKVKMLLALFLGDPFLFYLFNDFAGL